jgi:hypothetical protein
MAGTTLLNPGCDSECYQCECECLFLLSLSGSLSDICSVVAQASLIYRCDGIDSELNLDLYGAMGRVTGDDGVIWEGPLSSLPSSFSARLSDTFHLEAWTTLAGGYGGYGGCVGLTGETTYTVSPSCKTCPTNVFACECALLGNGSVPTALVTVSGTAVSLPWTLTALCSPSGTIPCPNIAGSYIVPCATVVYRIRSFACSGSFGFSYYVVTLTVTNSTAGLSASLDSGVQTHATPRATGVVESQTFLPGSLSAGGQISATREANVYICSTGSVSSLITLCTLQPVVNSTGTIPTANACDLSAMSIGLSR